MLDKKQVEEIREHLNRSQNPIFFFDNDVDGLCSFILLRKYSEKGKGVAIKSFPSLDLTHFKKVHELNSDYIFILDRSLVSEEFFKEAEKFNIPIICIDHHEVPKNISEFAGYYNPLFNKTKKESNGNPTTYLCYQVSEKKSDLWIAIVGCVADKFLPEFYEKFKNKFPELAIDSKDAFEIRYKSKIGEIVKILSSALKDRTTNVVLMMKFLINSKGPYDVLEEDSQNATMHKRFNEINMKYRRLIEKAEEVFKIQDNSEKVFFFKYGGELSISSELSDELSFKFPGKIIVVAYDSGIKANISARGKRIKSLISKAIKGFENASSGGHEDAVGGRIKSEDIDKFIIKLKSIAN